MKKRWLVLGALVAIPLALMLWHSDTNQDLLTSMASKSDVEVTEAEYPDRVYWGDTHLHTSYSFNNS